MKDTIIDVDMIWGTVGSPEWKYKGIRVDNRDGKSKLLPVGTSDGEPIGLINNTILGIADFF